MAVDWIAGIGVAGSCLTAIGFGFTVQQLRRTANATEAVKKAVGGLRNRMAAFDYASECVRAARSLQHASQLLKLRQWGDAAGTLLEVQAALHRISVGVEASAEVRKLSGDMSNYLLEAVGNLEEAEDKKTSFSSADLLMTIRKLTNTFDAQVISVNKELYDNAQS